PRLRRRVPRRDDSLAAAELLDPQRELQLRSREPRFLLTDLTGLLLERLELGERGVLAEERLAGEIFTPERERLLRLVGPDRETVPKLPPLLLELRLGGRDLDEALLHLDELALLLLVAVLEDFARVLRSVECGGELGLRQQDDACEEPVGSDVRHRATTLRAP